jgi:hypothetical protein
VSGGGAPLEFTGRELRFELPYETPTLNETQRMNYHKLGQRKKRFAWDIKILTMGLRPPTPFALAHVRIERHGRGVPDYDGLVGGLKILIDCLIPEGEPFKRGGKFVFPHPGGLGIIADDKPAVLRLEPIAVKIKRTEKTKTIVIIKEISCAD